MTAIDVGLLRKNILHYNLKQKSGRLQARIYFMINRTGVLFEQTRTHSNDGEINPVFFSYFVAHGFDEIIE